MKLKTFSSDAVKYWKPTYIGIQNAKHLASSAYNQPPRWNVAYTRDAKVREKFGKLKERGKTGYVVTVDEGPDKNSMYEKTIPLAVDFFNTYDLDTFFLVKNKPGRSTFNRIKRRMTAVSTDLGSVLLEHGHFGAHLDDKRNTVVSQLELKNFKHTRKILGKIRSGMVINGHPVMGEYIGDKAWEIVKDVSEKWR